jgi:hypothetical protein
MAPMPGQAAWRLVLTLGLGIGLVACRAKPGPADDGPVIGPEPAPAKPPSPVRPPGCEELGPVSLSIEPAVLLLTCKDRHHECSGRATLTVHSCAAEAFEFHEVILTPAPPMRPPVVRTDRVVRLEPGDAWTMELGLDHSGVYELSLPPIAASGEGPRASFATATLTVENPARDQGMAACRECNGDWGNHGMFGIEGCVCRTRDGGTPCDDGADCESKCIEQVPGSGFRCAEFWTTWGCHAYLPEGWSKQRPRKGEGIVPPYVCID